jgi:hypothetical protein
MVTFSFLDFLADLLQKSISVASNLFAYCVFSVHVSAPYSKILWNKAWYISFFFWFCEGLNPYLLTKLVGTL